MFCARRTGHFATQDVVILMTSAPADLLMLRYSRAASRVQLLWLATRVHNVSSPHRHRFRSSSPRVLSTSHMFEAGLVTRTPHIQALRQSHARPAPWIQRAGHDKSVWGLLLCDQIY
jgi:hypothetical protein